jgi:phosphoglycerate dehydrogenase-like enzyme
MNHDAFSSMKQDAFLINLSRGGLVDRDALEEALASGRIAGAGLDVFWEEPPDPQDPIFNYNVLATPHIGGSTDVSMRGIVKVVAENIRRVEKNEEPFYLKYPESQ